MAERWSEWIEHDGGEAPRINCGIMVACDRRSGDLFPSHDRDDGIITTSHPAWNWEWKWKRVGLLRQEKVRVCVDPKYHAITRYRLQLPPASEAFRQLEQIVDQPEQITITDPEGEKICEN